MNDDAIVGGGGAAVGSGDVFFAAVLSAVGLLHFLPFVRELFATEDAALRLLSVVATVSEDHAFPLVGGCGTSSVGGAADGVGRGALCLLDWGFFFLLFLLFFPLLLLRVGAAPLVVLFSSTLNISAAVKRKSILFNTSLVTTYRFFFFGWSLFKYFGTR